MTSRRSFLKGLAALPVLSAVRPTQAEPKAEPEEFVGPDIPTLCPHCFDMVGRGHMCEGYRLWLKKHGRG